MPLKILAISYLFPNSQKPDFGIFVMNRLAHINTHCQVKVINPVPWFPLSFLFEKYCHISKIPYKETLGGMEVFHPRFFIIPGMFKFIDALTFTVAVMACLYRWKKRFEFDLIDLHWTYPDLPSGRLLSWLTSKKLLVTIRGKEALCLNEKSLRSRIIRYCLPLSDQIITLSDELKSHVLDIGFDKDRVLTIRNGVDLDIFRQMDQKRCRHKLALPENDYLVLSVGSLIFRKGHDRAIRSFKNLLDIKPDAHLYILGAKGPEGDYRGKLTRLVQTLSLCNHVTFIGRVSNKDLALWYNAADLFCLLSRGEGSPNVLTEALACGCPCVATDVGCVPDILSHSFLGQVAPNHGPDVFPFFMDAAKGNYDRKQIAQHMKSYGWGWCAKNVIEVYNRILNLKPGK